MPVTIHTSNRMEILLEHLAGVLNEPVGPPLLPETIVIQSRGMERWISMELAKKFGVWCNGKFPFPNKFVWDLFASAMQDVDKSNCFDTEILTWRVVNQLEQLLDRPEFSELQHYLTGHSRELKRYQLACRIADTFDQYTLYRGDELERWESGATSNWQAVIWKALAEEGKGEHRARVKTRFLTRLNNGEIDVSLLPPRVLIFGLSYLPSFHLEVLAGIASYIDVHLFALSPCREYWGDILSEKRRAKVSKELGEVSEEGNALLASLGNLGRNFSEMILGSGAISTTEQDEYVESSGDTLLSSLQNGILNLINADPENKIEIAPDDRSIAVHSCHSRMREVEVLHDQLLEMFATMDGLAPRDIIVMTPDIESYSSYISAVFSGNQAPERRIPFTIADRSMSSEGEVGEALMAILALPGGRFTAPEVIDILDTRAVCRSFGIAQGDLDLIKSWLEETHISWGMSRDDRHALGLPSYSEGSWMAGLERLVIGYAMPSDGSLLFDGILPFDNMEGEAANILGHFVTFVRSLHATASDLLRPRTLAQWWETLRTLQKAFFTPPQEDIREYASVQAVIDSLGSIEELSGYTHDVSLDIIRPWLQRRLANEGGGTGFLSGRVTFCAMLPMRSIPQRVVALLGMNDGAFPRQNSSTGFDIIAASPRPGDRSLRDEDRYLFLEAILSARERLYISYTGLSIRDNSIIPPSVLVSELLDYLDRGYTCGEGAFHKNILTLHRLQPFSKAYFTGGEQGLFSYSSENLTAARTLLNAGGERARFFTGPLSQPAASFREVRVADLLMFFQNPSASILRQRLGIIPEETASPLAEREIFDLDNLQEYNIKKELLAYSLTGKNSRELQPMIRAGGLLPPGGQGDLIFTRLAEETDTLAGMVRKAINGAEYLPPLDVDLTIKEYRVYGRIGTVLPEQMIRYRSAKLSAKDEVKLWIEHLILNAANTEGYPAKSTLIMLDGTVTLQPVEESSALLELLLNRYWQGLSMPLHFFPRSSLAFANSGTVAAAEAEWNNRLYPESGDASHKLCHGDVSPFDETFVKIAEEVFKSYLEHREVMA